MFTDTHCHLRTMQNRGIDLEKFFFDLKNESNDKMPFLIDIGTKCDDLENRFELKSLAQEICGSCDFLKFSAGIWPDDEAILNRNEQILVLEDNIKKNVCALGECGLDRNWNTAEKGGNFLHQEEELFEMQLDLAKKYNLPVIIHSRDAFDATFNIMKSNNCEKAVIHCFSYGINEARAFLDLGYYISFSGSITFGKKNNAEEYKKLAQFVPQEMLLLETDAPYLTPTPFRGQINTPIFVKHTYQFVADARNIPVENLCDSVRKNTIELFSL